MSVAYATQGLVGVLTPQANTTVEPELRLLLPPGIAWINGRLTSGKDTIEARLRDYFATLDHAVAQFANAPLDAIGVACTGPSYLVGAEEEDRVTAALSASAGVPVVTAAQSVIAALRALDVAKVGLVSPYTPSLTEASTAYWRARGFDVVQVVSAYRETTEFHPIYSLDSDAAAGGIDAAAEGAEAVLLLGTGMPTLDAIRARPQAGGATVLSCMQCLAWRLVEAAARREPAAASLSGFAASSGWTDRLDAFRA